MVKSYNSSQYSSLYEWKRTTSINMNKHNGGGAKVVGEWIHSYTRL